MSGVREILPLGQAVKPSRPRVKPSDYPDLPFIGMEHVEAHTMKLLGSVLAGTMKSSAVHFKPGDVLYGRLRPYLNKVYRPNFEGLCSAEFIVLPENERVEGAYLQYFLNSAAFVRYTSHLNAGDRPRVDFDQLASYQIPVPSRAEQREIVAELEKQFSRLDEAVANLQRVKANLKRYKASVLKEAVEGRLVPTEAELARREGRNFETGEQLLQRVLQLRRCNWAGKGAYKKPDWSAGARSAQLPDGWTICGVDHVLPASKDALKTGPFGSLLKKHEHRESGVAVLGIENISAMRFIKGSKIAISEEKAARLREYDARPGDVLVSRSGTVGEVCVVPDDIGHARISTNLLRIRLASGGMLPEFFVLLFNGSPFVLRQVSELCKGSTRDFLNQAILKKLCFALPPLHEQHRILEEVDRCLSLSHEIESEVDRNLMRARALRQSTLATAFCGGR